MSWRRLPSLFLFSCAMVRLCSLESVFLLLYKNFLELCLDLLCLGLLIRDTNYGSVRSLLFLIFIISSLIILNSLFSSVLFHSFSLSHVLCVPFSRVFCLFQKFCFHGAICLTGDIKFSFQLPLQVLPADAWFTSSGCSSTCMQSLVGLVLLSAGFIRRVP